MNLVSARIMILFVWMTTFDGLDCIGTNDFRLVGLSNPKIQLELTTIKLFCDGFKEPTQAIF